MRVMVYIDGFNLYFGMHAQFGKKYLWLDIKKLAQSLLITGQTLAGVKYFTSRVANQPEKERRQKTYLEAVQTVTHCEMFFGRYQSNSIECRTCGSVWPSPKEKMTDVNIATHIIIDAYQDKYDTALLVSGDSDLIPPLRSIKENFPQKKVGVAFPPMRHSLALHEVVDFSFIVGKKKLRDSQMPDEVVRADGFILKRPTTWRL